MSNLYGSAFVLPYLILLLMSSIANPKRWSMGGAVTPDDSIIKPDNGFTGQSIEQAFSDLFGDISSNDILNSSGDSIQADYALLNYLIGEQNWDRTNPRAVAERLQAMGMSRQAALQAAAGVTGSETPSVSASPSPSTASPIYDAISTAAGAAGTFGNIYATLASLPFDNRVKAANADLLNTTNSITQEQRNGIALASSAVQYLSNLGYDFKDSNATTAMDYLRGIPDAAAIVGAFKSNPYAMSSLSTFLSQDYGTRAASYSPEIASFNALQQRAITSIVKAQSQPDVLAAQRQILLNAETRDNVATSLYEQVQSAIANGVIAESDFNAANFQNLSAHIKQFNAVTLARLENELQELTMLNDPVYREKRINQLWADTDYQAMQAILGYNIAKEVNDAYSNEYERNPDKLNEKATQFLYGQYLGGFDHQNNVRGWLGTSAGLIGSIGACILGGAKILSAKSASSLVHGYTVSATGAAAGAGLPLFAPPVSSATMQLMMPTFSSSSNSQM